MRISRRKFIRNAATGLMVPSLMSCVVRGSVPFPLGFWKPASSVPYSPAAAAALSDWVTRVQGQGSDVTISGTQTAVGIYIDGLMTDGVWSELVRHSIFAGDGLNALKAPLKNGGRSATDLIPNFVGGDYSQSTGLTADGSSKYVNTSIFPSDSPMGDDDIHLSLYVRTAGTTGGRAGTMAAFSGSQALDLLASWTAVSYWACNDAATNLASGADVTGTGMYVGSRTSTSSSVLYRNSSSLGSVATAGGARATGEILVFATNDNGTFVVNPTNFTSGTNEQYSIGIGLTSTDVTNLTNRYATLRTALGR